MKILFLNTSISKIFFFQKIFKQMNYETITIRNFDDFQLQNKKTNFNFLLIDITNTLKRINFWKIIKNFSLLHPYSHIGCFIADLNHAFVVYFQNSLFYKRNFLNISNDMNQIIDWFHMHELLMAGQQKQLLQDCNHYCVQLSNHQILFNNLPLKLSNKEFIIMTMLIQKFGCLVKYEDVIFKLWNQNTFKQQRKLSVYIFRIRQKLYPNCLLSFSKWGLILKHFKPNLLNYFEKN